MTKAIRFDRLGGPEVLHLADVTLRPPGAGEVSIAVKAVGLNRAESGYYHGHYPEKPELPSGLGYEAVGIVTAVGPGVDGSLVGRRFETVPGYSMNRFPVLAEEAVVPADALAPLPDSLSAEQGAAVWMQYCTAYGALVPFGKVGPGDHVIVTAASSSVGLAAIQTVKAQGGTSIAVTRTAAKKGRLAELGADHVVVTEEEDLVARVEQITGGRGARVVFDPISGSGVEALARATADGGTVFLYGVLSGEPTPFPMSAFGRGISFRWYTFNELRGSPEWEVMKSYVYDRLVDGSFKPEIARTFPFAETRRAYEYLESNQQVGKVVVTF